MAKSDENSSRTWNRIYLSILIYLTLLIAFFIYLTNLLK